MAENIFQDTASDYATKKLPQIPFRYSALEDRDVVVIEEVDVELETGSRQQQPQQQDPKPKDAL